MSKTSFCRLSTQKNLNNRVAEAACIVPEVKLALRQRAKELNRENYLRTLQLALHADSEKVWNMTIYYW